MLQGGLRVGRISCAPPLQDPANTNAATWNATLEIFEAGTKLPRVEVAGNKAEALTTVWFASREPVIAVTHAERIELGLGAIVSSQMGLLAL